VRRYSCLKAAVPAAIGLMLLCPPSATAGPTPATASPSPSTAACSYPTVIFNGAAYCPATIVGVGATSQGIGTRVVLRGVTVTEVTSRTVTVATWDYTPCPPGKWCGAGYFTLQSLTVSWSGTGRPAYGDVLDLFGRTITASITPSGYLKTGFCPIDWC